MSSDGNYVVVGTNEEGISIYQYSGNDWVQMGNTIGPPVPGTGAGSAVAISDDGQTAVMGIRGANINQGEVRIYQYTNGSWQQRGSILSGFGMYGSEVDINSDGSIVAIANYHQNSSVQVFSWGGSDWVQMGTDLNNGAYSYFGKSICLSANGQTIAVGTNGNGGSVPTLVYAFTGSSWTQKGGNIVNPDPQGLNFGASVSLSSDGNKILIGDNMYWNNRGRAYMFEFNNNSWTIKGQGFGDIWSNSSTGESVAISGDGTTVTVGSPEHGFGDVRTYRYCTPGTINTNVNLSGQTLTASATSVAYQWIDCNNGNNEIPGATSQNFTPSTSGSYAVIITSGICSDTSSCHSVTISNVGLDEYDLNNSITVYPNPSVSSFTVKLNKNGAFALKDFSIYDSRGVQVQYNLQLFDQNEVLFSIDNEPGIYFLELKTGNGNIIMKKIIKE